MDHTTQSPRDEWHPVLVQVFRAMDAAEIRWALLRPPSPLAAPSGDIDLLVHPGDRKALTRILSPLGFVRRRARTQPDAGSPDLFFLSYEPLSDCWLDLQITSEISFGRRLRLTSATCRAALDRRSRQGEAWFLRAEDELWTTLAHAAFDKGQLSARHRVRLRNLALVAAPNGPVEKALDPHLPGGWSAEKVVAALRNEGWDDVDSFIEQLRDCSPTQARWMPDRQRIARGFRWAGNLRHPWLRRGVSVALLGPDGAGKSTLAESLAANFFLGGHAYYMDVRESELQKVSALRIPGLTFVAFLLILWRRLLGAHVRQARGEAVIFDRYMYDAQHVDEDAVPASQRSRWARWMHTHLLPDTALGLVLDAPGNLMFARKGERSPEDLENERQRWLALARRHPHFFVLDSTQAADDVRRQATAIIWAEYARRWTAGRGDRESTSPARR